MNKKGLVLRIIWWFILLIILFNISSVIAWVLFVLFIIDINDTIHEYILTRKYELLEHGRH